MNVDNINEFNLEFNCHLKNYINNETNLENNILSKSISTNYKLKNSIKKESKISKKQKISNKNYTIPTKYSHNSSLILTEIIDKIVLSFDLHFIIKASVSSVSFINWILKINNELNLLLESELDNINYLNEDTSKNKEYILSYKDLTKQSLIKNCSKINYEIKKMDSNEDLTDLDVSILNFNSFTFNIKINKNIENSLKTADKIIEKNIKLDNNNEIIENTLIFKNNLNEIKNTVPLYNTKKKEANVKFINNYLTKKKYKVLDAFNSYNNDYYNNLSINYENKFIDNNITNVDLLRFKVENGYYISIDSFFEDVCYLINYLKSYFDKLLTNKYLLELLKKKLVSTQLQFLKFIMHYFPYNYFSVSKNNDYKAMIDGNNLPKRDENSNYKNIPIAKEYEEIDDYYHIFPEITKNIVNTTINPSCNINNNYTTNISDCCNSYNKLGPYNLENSTWKSTCNDRNKNIECNPNICGCNENCKNQDFRNKNFLSLEKDVVLKYSWGIDLYTFRNLINFIPFNITDKVKSLFIEKILIPELSNNTVNGWNIKLSLDNLLFKLECNSNDYLIAKHLISTYNLYPITKKCYTAFCKGLGIFCNTKLGIDANKLIAPYYGEIYPQWYWFEKQDLIKSKNLDKDLPDFYNIQLERLKWDPFGYNILMIDPNSKGNFTSRMSHSCNPNCQTALMISDNKYSISMYAVKRIEYGEELTFDYNSITEKENEYKESVCLCGTYYCRGNYLIFSNGKNFNEIINNDNSYIQKNALLLLSSLGFSNLIPKSNIIEFLNKNSLNTSVLDNIPDWMLIYIYSIVKFYVYEFEIISLVKNILDYNGYIIENFDLDYLILNNYKIFLSKKNNNNNNKNISNNSDHLLNKNEHIVDINLMFKNYLIETYNNSFFANISLKESRLQNLCITIDKVKHVLMLIYGLKNNNNICEPPIIFASNEDITDYLWINKDYSVRSLIYNNIINLINKCSENVNNLLIQSVNLLNKSVDNNSIKDSVSEYKNTIGLLSCVFRKISKDSSSEKLAAFEPLSDILYLISKTNYYFKQNPNYKTPNQSVKISIRQRDISTTSKVKQSGNMSQIDLNKIVAEGSKLYDKNYIWGQLIGWYKQTVNNPDPSLSNERKGTVLYPDVDCFFLSNISKQEGIDINSLKDLKYENVFQKNISEELDNDNIIKDNKLIKKGINNTVEIYNTRKNKHNKFVKNGISVKDIIFNYPCNMQRNEFLEKLYNNPYMYWHGNNRWSYKNRLKIFGSIQFDYVIDEISNNNYLSEFYSKLNIMDNKNLIQNDKKSMLFDNSNNIFNLQDYIKDNINNKKENNYYQIIKELINC